MAEFLEDRHRLVLDPFAGTGRCMEVGEMAGVRMVGTELEGEWARIREGVLVANALELPFANGTFCAVVTSPAYGNRLADHHRARDAHLRRSYAHDLGRDLSGGNSGALQWGDAYRKFHLAAWAETARVLSPGGRLILNISDHIRGGERQCVSSWHASALLDLGFLLVDAARVVTPRMRAGANRGARVPAELVLAFDLGDG